MKWLKIFILALLLFTICLGGGYLVLTWNAPLGPALAPPVQTEIQDSYAQVSITDTPEPETQPSSTPAPSLTPTIAPVCGGPPSLNILLSGVASEGYLYGLADAIRVVRVDFQRQTVSVLAFPRDLWVDIPGIADHGIRQGKLNQAYFYGTEGMGYFDGSGYGSGLLAATMRDNFGVQIDRYLSVNLASFRRIIDAMGGVDVYFSAPVYIKSFEKPKLYLKAGSHHLTGKQAEQVVRTRIQIGDFGRIDHQSAVLQAVALKMLSPSGIQHLPAVIQQVKNSVLTDLSPAEISQLICLAEKVDPQSGIIFQEMPQGMLREDRVYDPYLDYWPYVLLYDREEITRFVSGYLDGELDKRAGN